jgi:hypothetical protein
MNTRHDKLGRFAGGGSKPKPPAGPSPPRPQAKPGPMGEPQTDRAKRPKAK